MLYALSEVEVFVTGLDHPEGVAVGRDGSLYTGGEAGQIYRISPDGKMTTIIANTGGSCLGITLDQQENIYVCNSGRRQVLKVTHQGAITIVAESVRGRSLICPNFSVFDRHGNLYFSDSGVWKQRNAIVCRVSQNGEVEVFAEGPFHFANGIALDSKEQFLYVVESNLDRVIRIEIRSDGSCGVAEPFVEGLARIPDGLAFDAQDNLYVTTYASNTIYRVSTQRHIDTVCKDEECALLCQATNCAFGGRAFNQMFVANLGARHISMLNLNIEGQLLWNHRV